VTPFKHFLPFPTGPPLARPRWAAGAALGEEPLLLNFQED